MFIFTQEYLCTKVGGHSCSYSHRSTSVLRLVGIHVHIHTGVPLYKGWWAFMFIFTQEYLCTKVGGHSCSYSHRSTSVLRLVGIHVHIHTGVPLY